MLIFLNHHFDLFLIFFLIKLIIYFIQRLIQIKSVRYIHKTLCLVVYICPILLPVSEPLLESGLISYNLAINKSNKQNFYKFAISA